MAETMAAETERPLAASFSDSLAAAESAAAALSTCEDMDEAMRLFREGEAGLRRAERRLAEVEHELQELPTRRTGELQPGQSYADCLRAAEEATRALTSCQDAEEALRLMRAVEASLQQADALLGQVEGAMRRVSAGDEAEPRTEPARALSR